MEKIKLGMIGLGKTGRIIAESLFNDDKFELVFAVKKTLVKPTEYAYSVETCEMLPDLIEKFKPQIVIDFSTTEATLENIKSLNNNMGLIIGTTGFTNDEIKQIKRYKKKLRILFAPNISDGINILIQVCIFIKKIWQEADIEIIEQHFKTKKDSPSGTAKKIVETLKEDIPIHSIRAGGIIGIHEVIFVMKNQKIIVRHESFSREVFAQATKRAVIWLNKIEKPGYYEIATIYKRK